MQYLVNIFKKILFSLIWLSTLLLYHATVLYINYKIAMKQTILLLILLSLAFNCLVAKKTIDTERLRAAEAYERMFESAHPTPTNYEKTTPLPMVVMPLGITNKYAIFEDVNMIDQIENGLNVQNESSIAVNPRNPLNLISSAVDYRDNSSTWVYVSQDGGKSWVNINLGKPDPAWRSTNDPSVAFDSDGNGYLVYGGSSDRKIINGVLAGENAVFIAKTTDQGKTWTPHNPIIIHIGEQTLDSTFEDKYYISVDNVESSKYFKHLYVPWKRVTPRDSATHIVISKSTDQGLTWSKPVGVSDRLPGSSEDTTFGQSFPLASTGPNGEVYVVWNHGVEHGVGFAKSLNGGKKFSEPKIIQHYDIFGTTTNIGTESAPIYRHTVKGKVRAETYPTIVTDTTDNGRKGNIYVCYAGGNIPDIFCTKSIDQGETWSTPIRVHKDATNDQFWSWMSLDPKTGDIAIMYFSSARDPENMLVEAWVSYSNDGGDTWVDRPAAEFSSDLRNNPFDNSVFAGDYSGCAFFDGMIYPSWVDMRTGDNDNDVYTAIINTQAPMPVENFAATTIPEEREKVRLSWDLPDPMTRSFDQPLDAADFKFQIFKKEEFLAELGSDKRDYFDEGLVAYEKYHYSIKVVSGDDESGSKHDSAYAGGSKLPGPAEITAIEVRDQENDRTVTLTVQLPEFRDDETTILVNMAKVNIWRDGEIVQTIDVHASDAGKTVEFTDTPEERGYYQYAITVLDDNDPAFESPMSNEEFIYTGRIDDHYSDDFEGKPLKHYYTEGEWDIIEELNAVHESPAGDYEPKREYILQLFPVRTYSTPDADNLDIYFEHACIVYKNDKAYLEKRTSLDGEWVEIASWTQEDYEPWGDGELTEEDWKKEVFHPNANNDTTYLRFRLKTNSIREEDGWYIRNLYYSVSSTSVEDEPESTVKLFPNPAKDFLKIDISSIGLNKVDKISLYDVYGNRVTNFEASLYSNEILIQTNNLVCGVYYVSLKTHSGANHFAKFTIIR
jgi:type IX secretion system substrate protein